MLYGIWGLHQNISIENTMLVIVSMTILVIFLVIANRAKTLRDLMIYLLVIVVALSNIACFLGTVQGKIIALFYIINLRALFAALWPLMSQYYQKTLHISTQADRLPQRAFYLGIILMLLVGLPGSASFIGEFFILHGLMSQHMYWSVIIAFPIILMALVVLHILQIYVFNPSNISRVNLSLSPSLHLLCWSSIGFNVFNGVHPSLLLNTLSLLYGVTA
jgi:NADH-quinone oxidoreductase subunit M